MFQILYLLGEQIIPPINQFISFLKLFATFSSYVAQVCTPFSPRHSLTHSSYFNMCVFSGKKI